MDRIGRGFGQGRHVQGRVGTSCIRMQDVAMLGRSSKRFSNQNSFKACSIELGTFDVISCDNELGGRDA